MLLLVIVASMANVNASGVIENGDLYLIRGGCAGHCVDLTCLENVSCKSDGYSQCNPLDPDTSCSNTAKVSEEVRNCSQNPSATGDR